MAFRSPFSPTEAVGEFYMLRGVIISAFSHADFIAFKVIIRATQIENYRLSKKPPTRTEEKIELLRKISKTSGPLDIFANILKIAADRLEKFNEFRNLVVHGSYQIFDKGCVSFPEIHKIPTKPHTLSRHNSTTLDDLRKTAYKYVLFSNAFNRVYDRIDAAGVIPHVDFQSGWHSSLSPWKEDLVASWPRPTADPK